jgi:hypothetical protein
LEGHFLNFRKGDIVKYIPNYFTMVNLYRVVKIQGEEVFMENLNTPNYPTMQHKVWLMKAEPEDLAKWVAEKMLK